MNYRERRSHARGVYLYLQPMRVARNLEQRNAGTKGKNPKQGLTSTENLTIEISEGRQSPYDYIRQLT